MQRVSAIPGVFPVHRQIGRHWEFRFQLVFGLMEFEKHADDSQTIPYSPGLPRANPRKNNLTGQVFVSK